MTYTITIETPNKIEPGNIEHWKQLLQSPDVHYFITSIKSNAD